MYFVEFCRARKTLLIYAIILVFAALIAIWSIHTAIVLHEAGSPATDLRFSSGNGDTSHGRIMRLAPHTVPIVVPIIIAGYMLWAFTIALSCSLNRERHVLVSTFTKPASRSRIALSYFGVDAAAIVLAYAFAVLVIVLVIGLSLGGFQVFYLDDVAAWTAALAIAVAFMWYGVLQAVSSWSKGGWGLFAGLSWPGFFILAGLGEFTLLGPIVHDLFIALNVINPVAYAPLNAVVLGGKSALGPSFFNLPYEIRVPLVLAFAVAACAIATMSWKRVEA